MSSAARWGGLRLDPYNPKAFDADGDGIVQEGTAFERPVGMRIVDEFGRDLQPGITSNTRSSNWRVVDKDGNAVDYVPTYQRTPSQPVSNFVGTIGSRVGTVGDRVGTIGDRVQTLDKTVGTLVSLPETRQDIVASGASTISEEVDTPTGISEYVEVASGPQEYNLPIQEGQVLPDEMSQAPDMEKVSELISAVDGSQQIVPRAIASAFYQNDFSWLADQFAFDAGGYAHMGGDAQPVEGLSLADMAYVMSVFREDAQASARRVADDNGMVRVFRGGPISQTDEPVSVSLDRSDAEEFGDVFEYLVPVGAFEYEPPAGSSYAAEFLVNPNMMNLVNEETVNTNDETETLQQDEDEQSLVLPLLRAKNKRPRTNKTLAEIPTNPGQLAVPRDLQNNSIVNEASAIEAFNNGTELADIPSQFMHAAISANAQLEDGDPRKRFKKIPKNGGGIKNVQIYGAVDASGDTTNNGFVFTLIGPPESFGLQNPLKEVALQQILVSLGIDTSPATIDGAFVDYGGQTQDSFYAVFPHAFNEAPSGERVRPGIPDELLFKGNMDVQAMQMLLPDKGVRERLANFAVSYGLALEDRHPGNSMGGVFRDSDGTLRAHVVPIDLDIRGWDTDVNLSSYMLDFRMDLFLVDDIKKVLSIMPDPDSTQEPLPEQEKEKLQSDLIEIWSQITERFQQLAADADNVIESIVLNGRVSQYRTAYGWDEEKTMDRMVEVDEMSELIYDYISKGASRLSTNQERFFKLIFGS